jgi:meiotic recombination protein SPO11
MGRIAAREVIESLGGFLRLNTSLSVDEIRGWMKDLDEGHVRPLESSSEDYPRAPVLPSAEATKLEERAADPDPRLATLSVRYPTVSAPIAFPDHALEAVDIPARDVLRRLAQLKDDVVARVESGGEVPWVDLPDLHQANAIYDPRGNVFLGQKVRRLAFDRQGSTAFVRLLWTLEKASDNLRNGVCTTKRSLYYYHQAKLPDADADQVDSDRAITALANVLGVRRRTLGFVESRRGLVWGRLVVRDGEAVIDLSQIGPAGLAIPRFTDDVEIVSSDAAFILVVEKHSVASRLAQTRWWNDARCILVCGEGFPSLSTREFVRTLVDTLGIPALILVDGDPAGIRVALTYAHGSIATALETPWLACNNIWWVGLYPSDFDRHCRRSDLIRLGDYDREAARPMLEHPSDTYVNARVRNELALLVDGGAKVELDAIAQDMSRLVDDYLPKKLFDSDLVKL